MKKVIITFIAILILAAALTIYLMVPKEAEGINLDKMNQSQRAAWFEFASNVQRKEVLTPQQYHVLVDRNMEASFLGLYNDKTDVGDYYSAICNYHVFSSNDKFDGDSGYVDFQAINLSTTQFKQNPRTEQIEVFTICGEYLGYVEPSEILESGNHFIINSVALEFR